MTPSYLSEFPDFGPLDVVLPQGFTDCSWHNDAMPRWEKQLADGSLLTLWIDYADRSLSEFADSEHYFRFLAAHYTDERDWISDIGLSNDFSDIVSQMTAWEAQHAKKSEAKRKPAP
jgi:hypothetical protein